MAPLALLRGSAWVRWLALLTILAAALPAAGAGDQKVKRRPDSRLRPTDPRTAALVEAGIRRSATFRLLVETIERSDLIVIVDTRELALPSRLEFLSAVRGARYVHVSLRGMGIDNDLLPWLAHELGHAVEIARAPEVRDGASLGRFFERIGGGWRTGGAVELETVWAQQLQQTVLAELRRGGE